MGTGSGYQTAILAQLVEHVYSVERIKPLQLGAKKRLSNLKLYNAVFKHSDGGHGWPQKGPFDGILSAAAPRAIPPELLQQLVSGYRDELNTSSPQPTSTEPPSLAPLPTQTSPFRRSFTSRRPTFP